MKPVPVWESRDSTNEALNNLPFDMKQPIIEAIQSAITDEVKEFEDSVFDYADQQLINNATGIVLDGLAELHGVFRGEGESDDELRSKLKVQFLQQSLSVSREDVRTGLESAFGTDEFIIINRTGQSIWLIASLGCYSTTQDFSSIAEFFPVNHNLKISVYERPYAGGKANINTRAFGSFFVDNDLAGIATALVYNKENQLYGN